MHTVCGHAYDDYIHMVRSFHGAAAPGMLLGGYMVDLGLQNISQGQIFDAICETGQCLPDAIQLLTPCTVGNGWLKILPLGRFALALYDKYEGFGVRVSMDHHLLRNKPGIKEWYYKLKPKKEQNTDRLIQEIVQAETGLFRVESVRIQSNLLKKSSMGPTGNCPVCGEGYPIQDGRMCRACQGQSPYVLHELHAAEK